MQVSNTVFENSLKIAPKAIAANPSVLQEVVELVENKGNKKYEKFQ
jgi:hypothetical protein